MSSPFRLTSLRCEYHVNPLGIGIRQPRLSWQLDAGGRRGVTQSAYQILAASTAEKLAADEGDRWDSGRVAGDASIHVVYGGNAVPSRTRVWWKVRAWDGGQPSAWSEPAWWETGLLAAADWNPAGWIASPMLGGTRVGTPAPYLRRDLRLDGEIVSARLYVTALGLYECYLNGQRVGREVFRPGWTDYRKRIQYDTYDVTALVRPGANAAGAILGDGWYCGFVGPADRQGYGERPGLLALLAVTLADGSTQTIATGGDWKTSSGPILENDFLMGESFDRRLCFTGASGSAEPWSEPGFDESAWLPVKRLEPPAAPLVAPPGQPVRRVLELPEAARLKLEGAAWGLKGCIVDLGQNMVGWARLKVRAKRGVTIRLRYVEILDAKGRPYTENLRAARVTDYYTCATDGEETWEPRFTFHGFRYVEVTSRADFELPPGGITGVVLQSDTAPTGEFECSEGLLNQLQHNIQWGQRGNFLEAPTDCPQRDERLGWMGDAQVFIRTAAFNMDVAPFFTKWQDDIRDSQGEKGDVPPVVPKQWEGEGGPAWEDAAIICPWTIYLCYGDRGLLAEHYDSLRKFVGFLEATSRDGLRSFEGSSCYTGFGDWLALDGSGKTDGGTPKELIGTAFFAHSTRLLGKIAGVLGEPDEARRCEARFEEIRAAFQREFVSPAGLMVGGTQTSYVLALHFDLLPENLRAAAASALVRDIRSRGNHLSTGFVGTPYLPHVLTRHGHLDVAYELLHQKTWPSWLYAVTQGATTIWERWDGWTQEKGFQDAGMNSFNHYAYGAIGEWLYSEVAGLGLDPARPGYKHLVIQPRPGGGLTHARASLRTMYGLAESGWRTGEDGAFQLEVTVPANCTATVWLPATDPALVRENGQPIERTEGLLAAPRREENAVACEIGSGAYRFSVSAA